MSSFFDRLNLQPSERRLVVAVAIVFFVVLNIWFVWPHFDDWKLILSRTKTSRDTLQKYRNEVARMDQYQAKLTELESAGTEVASEEQALALQTTVAQHANKAGVMILNVTSKAAARSSETNQFFDESAVSLTFSSGDKELVRFLVSLATGSSIIRVRDLNVRPDQRKSQLSGTMILVASYRKASPESKGGPAPSVASKQ